MATHRFVTHWIVGAITSQGPSEMVAVVSEYPVKINYQERAPISRTQICIAWTTFLECIPSMRFRKYGTHFILGSACTHNSPVTDSMVMMINCRLVRDTTHGRLSSRQVGRSPEDITPIGHTRARNAAGAAVSGSPTPFKGDGITNLTRILWARTVRRNETCCKSTRSKKAIDSASKSI